MSNVLEWIEYNPTMFCQCPFLVPQPAIKGKAAGCSYCYLAQSLPQTIKEAKAIQKKELTTNQVKDFIKNVADFGIRRMCVLGGEPQTRMDFDEIIGYACKKIELVHLTTNGIGTKKHLNTLLKVPLLEISVDSNIIDLAAKTRPLIQVKAALQSVELLYKKHPFLCINAVVTPAVLSELWSFINWSFQEKNIKKINLYPLLNENKKSLRITKKQADSIINEAEKKYMVIAENYCKSGKHVVVNFDGSVFPCAAFLGTDVTLGTVFDLKKAINNPLINKYKKYNFKSVAPKNIKSFKSSNCPGKKLYDNNWKKPKVQKLQEHPKNKEMYCMRCGMKRHDRKSSCQYCGFSHFDNKQFGMVCSCFSILNPKYFARNNFNVKDN